MVREIEALGFIDPVLGAVRPGEFSVNRDNLRESMVFEGLNSRMRAVVRLILDADLPRHARAYAPESVTGLAKVLRERFPAFVGSEYLPSAAERDRFPGTRHEDVQALSFENETLDLYVSCEVLEHIPSIPRAMAEASRVLAPGGFFIATFPFRLVDRDTQRKASMGENGSIEFLMEPEYHGNPVDAKGSLVFSIPGWDILDLARQSGFASVEMVAVSSRTYAIAASTSLAPVMVMRAVK